MDLHEGEVVLKEVRKHWFIMAVRIVGSFFAAILPPVVYYIGAGTFRFHAEGEISSLILLAYWIWLLIVWLSFFVWWTDYYLDAWHITNERIIDIEQIGLFHREINSVPFNRIQDITTEVSGVLETFLRFGDIHVQTAGERRTVIIKNADDPESVKKFIFNQMVEMNLVVSESSVGRDGVSGPSAK